MALKNGTAAFTEFAARFFEETKNRFPACVSLWAKWDPEDLIPFLSDFDSRVVCTDAVGPDDWVEFDRAIGEIHLDLTRTHRDWARILEHTPGVNVTRDEMLDPLLFHPETAQWSHYLGDNEWWPAVEAHHRRQDWGDRHEYCFLRRFLYYYGPYQHGIDPPINLGCYEHKYALHSRLWHYFVPALQAALALVRRRTIRGKFETLCGWREIMPSETVLSRAQEIVERHYEVSELHDEWALARLENELYRVLEEVLDCVKDSITLFDATGPADAVRYKRELAAIAPDPLMTIYAGVSFSRVRRGRYFFYLNCPEFFDSRRLIVSEMNWLKGYFTRPVFEAYGRLKTDRPGVKLDEVLEELRAGVLSEEDVRLVKRVFQISEPARAKGHERQALASLLEIYSDYQVILERILTDARAMATTAAHAGRDTEMTRQRMPNPTRRSR